MSDPTRVDDDGATGADELLKLIQDPFQSSFKYDAFWASLATSLGVTVGLALIFSLFRPRNSVVYAPKLKHADKSHAPPPLGKGVFAWIKPILTTKERDLVDRIGMDATIFLRFTRMCRNMFLVLSIFGCAIMIPVNVTGSNKDISKDKSLFDTMTPQYVFGSTLWANVVSSWVADIVVIIFLWYNYREVTKLRKRYFQTPEYQKSLHARSIMITHIPQSYRTDEGLLRLTDEVNPTPAVPRASIGRNVKDLPELILEHEKAVRQLEKVLAKYFKDPDNPPPNRPTCQPLKKDRRHSSEKVDAIDYLTDRIRDMEMEIKHVRESIDKRNAMPYGFASWESIEHAHAVAYAARNKHPHTTTIRLAPRPNDIIWANLALTKANLRWKRFVNIIWSAILTGLWIAPNAMIAIFLTDLGNLGRVWPAFKTSLDGHTKVWAAVQGIASPAVLSLVYLALPVIFRRLAIQAGKKTKTAREKHVIHSLYAFFVFNNLVVFSIFSTAWAFVAAVIQAKKNNKNVWETIEKGEYYVKFMLTLCQVAPFWVNWLLQRNLGAAIDLIQLINMVWKFFARKFLSPTPRRSIEWTAPPAFDFASYYNYFLFYTTVALCYSSLQPIVLPVTALYFSVDTWLKKYLLLYVFITKTESGGRYWRVLFNRVVFAAIFANCISALIIKARGSWTMIYTMAPLPIIMIAFKWYCRRTFDDQNQYYNRAIINDSEAMANSKSSSKKAGERLSTRFGHPALYKPLTTPMVHANAAEALEKILQSRQGMGVTTGDYSDIAMHRMSASQPGKTSRDQPTASPYEVVSENQLDFSYYKNRPDFRDEFGGGIYGPPDDMISERSHTPRTFMMGTGSPGSSRASSPDSSNFTNYRPNQHRRSTSYSSLQGRTPQIPDIPAAPAFYHSSNESERRLLSHAQTAPMAPAADNFSLARWSTHDSRDQSPSRYEPYRR